MTRYYMLAMTDMGCKQDEFLSEADRQVFLDGQDSTFDDFYCLDVSPIGEIDFYIANTGNDQE